MDDKKIPDNVAAACAEQHKDVAEWAMWEFYDGWQAAQADRGAHWRVMWFEWHDCGSIYADGYLACCDYHDEVGWPDEDNKEEPEG